MLNSRTQIWLLMFCLVVATMNFGCDESSSAPKIIFISATTSDGNLGGIAGADALCNADANKPNESNYKALVVDGTNRAACNTPDCSAGPSEHLDWVFAADTTYARADGTTVIGTTDANGLLNFPLTNTFSVEENTNSAARIWTGLLADWTTSEDLCNSWTDSGTNLRPALSPVTLVPEGGDYGRLDATTSDAISAFLQNCTEIEPLACVEQ